MTPEQLQVFLEDNRKSTAEAIRLTVNGKIDDMKKTHEQDMKRMMPIILAYEGAERRLEDAKTSGKAILWVAGFITALGGAWLVLKTIFFR